MSKTYVALIADAVASRDLVPTARARLQAVLHDRLRDWNRRYRRVLAARFAVTLGDELQCLLFDARPVWEIAHQIRGAFVDVEWVVACGRGPATTKLTAGITAPEVDGPCFHAARAALAAAKRDRRLFSFGGFADPHLDGCGAYYSALYLGWTARQRRAATAWRLGVAHGERLHPSALSHLRRRMAWPLVAEGDKMFRALLEAS